MAKIEVPKYIASSLDNFIVFQNESAQDAPYVLITVGDSAVGQNVTLNFSDADNENGVKYTLSGSAGSYVTSSTFNTSGDRFALMFSL